MKTKNLLIALITASLSGVASAENKEDLSVLFISGKDTHGWGFHDHNPGTAIISESLKKAMGEKVQIKVAWNTWPSKEDFAKADVCVVYSDGWNHSVIKGNERTDQIEAFMKSGKGVLRIHWATGSNPGDSQRHRHLFGGNMENNYSVHSTIWHQKFELGDHPISNGVKSFDLVDEGYFFMHWKNEDIKNIQPILSAKPPKNFKARSVTPKAKASIDKGEPQVLAWAFNHPNGGRAFSYTGGHSHWDWAEDNYRKTILNAIVWAGGKAVPKEGVVSPRPTAKRLLETMSERGNKRNPGWTPEMLQPLLDKMNQPGEKIDWRRPPFKK